MGVADSYKKRRIAGILGLGSIGIRHVQALKSLGIEKVVAFRSGKGQKKLPAELESTIEISADFRDLETADFFILSNPTSLHFGSLTELCKFGKPIFIEKPLCSSFKEAEAISELLNSYPARIQIGFCLRFNSLFKVVKSILETGQLGEVCLAKLESGQYLPLWHPYTDYRGEYFSRKDLGGGAIRTLSHEIDLALFFFGFPEGVKAFVDKVSDLAIDVDDYACVLLAYPKASVRIEIDFLQKNPKRCGLICGTEADLEYDLVQNKVCVYDKTGNLLQEVYPEKNDMYYDQMRNFLDNAGEENYSTLKESVALMKIIEVSEQYSENTKFIEL